MWEWSAMRKWSARRRWSARLQPSVFWVLVLAGSFQSACSRDAAQPVSPSPAGGLIGTPWSLVELAGQMTGIGAGGVVPTLLLAETDSRASGSAGCNRYSASYTLTDDRLRFGLMAMTRMFCAVGMDVEDRYVTALQSTRAYRVIGSRLELIGHQGVVARFERNP